MKRSPMTKLIITLLAFTFATSFGCAASDDPTQDTAKPMTNQQIAKRMTDRLNQSITLDHEQYQKIYDLNLEYLPEMRRIASSDEFRFKKARQIRQIENKKQEQLKSILSHSEYQQYLRLKQEVLRIVRNNIKTEQVTTAKQSTKH